MATDDRTANLNLPKVHPDNNPRLEDVPRLRSFADDVDAALASRPTSATVTAEIGAAVAPKADDATVTAALAGKVPTSRTLTAGAGLTGGGAFTDDVTLSLSAGTIASLALADSAVQPARTVFSGTGLTGGGDLSANRTIALSAASITSLGKADSALQPADRAYASDADAEAGTSLTVVMNPDKARHMLDTRPPGVPVRWVSAAGGLTPAAANQGWFIGLDTGYSGNITLPDTLAPGFAITVFNNLAAAVNVVLGGTATAIVAGAGTTGAFTLEAKGIFTAVVSTGTNDLWVVSGAGLS